MIEPPVDQIEIKSQCHLALHYAAGPWLSPFIISVTSPIVIHALNSNVGPQQTDTPSLVLQISYIVI